MNCRTSLDAFSTHSAAVFGVRGGKSGAHAAVCRALKMRGAPSRHADGDKAWEASVSAGARPQAVGDRGRGRPPPWVTWVALGKVPLTGQRSGQRSGSHMAGRRPGRGSGRLRSAWNEAPSHFPRSDIRAHAGRGPRHCSAAGRSGRHTRPSPATRARSAGACGPAALSVQMVWEEGCVVIVMLTPLSENGVRQCHHYWPDEGSSLYHIYEVRPPVPAPHPCPQTHRPCGRSPP